MSLQTSLTAHFDAPAEKVWEMLADARYLDAALAGTGTWKVEHSDSARTISSVRKLVVDLPAPARNFLGSEICLHETQEWKLPSSTGQAHASLTITLEGAPATVAGNMTLTPTGQECDLVIDVDIAVKIPLFGSSAEKIIAEQLTDVVRMQEELGKSWLATH